MSKKVRIEDLVFEPVEDELAFEDVPQPEQPTRGQSVSKSLFPSSTKAVETSGGFSISPPKRQPGQSDVDYQKAVSDWQAGNRQSFGGAVDDVGSMLTRAGGSIASKLGLTSATGGKSMSFAEGMQDPNTSYMRAAKDYLSKVIQEKWGNLSNDERSYISQVGDALVMELAGAGYLGSVIAEDPSNVGSAGLSAVKAVTPSMVRGGKSAVSFMAGNIPQQHLDKAARTPLSTLEAAAGTEDKIAHEVADATSPETRKKIFDPLEQQADQIVSDPKFKVRVDQSGKGKIKASPLQEYDLDASGNVVPTGKTSKYPVEQYQGDLKDLEDISTSLESKALVERGKKQFEAINEKIRDRKIISGEEAVNLKRDFQNLASSVYGIEGKADALDNIYKGFAASLRKSLEQTAVNQGKPEYVKVMREIANKNDFFKEMNRTFTGKISQDKVKQARKSIEKIGSKKAKEELEQLEQLDKIITEATGLPSDMAERALLAHTAKSLGIEPGKTIPVWNIVNNGKTVWGSLIGGMFAGAASKGDPLITVLGGIAGQVATSPKAARLYYQGMNLAEAAMKSKRVATLLNSMKATGSATALARMEKELEKELAKLNQEKE